MRVLTLEKTMDPPRKGLPSPTQIVQDVQAAIDEVLIAVLNARREEGLELSAELEEELRNQIKKKTHRKISQGVLDAYVSGRYTQIEDKTEELFHTREPEIKKPVKMSPGNSEWPQDPHTVGAIKKA